MDASNALASVVTLTLVRVISIIVSSLMLIFVVIWTSKVSTAHLIRDVARNVIKGVEHDALASMAWIVIVMESTWSFIDRVHG